MKENKRLQRAMAKALAAVAALPPQQRTVIKPVQDPAHAEERLSAAEAKRARRAERNRVKS